MELIQNTISCSFVTEAIIMEFISWILISSLCVASARGNSDEEIIQELNAASEGYGILSNVRTLIDLASNSTRLPGSFQSADSVFGRFVNLKDNFVVYTFEITKATKSDSAFFMTDSHSKLTFEVSGLGLFPCDEEYLYLNDGATIESTLCDGKASVASRGSRFLYLQYGRQTNTGTAFNITVKAVPDEDAKTGIADKNSILDRSFIDSQICSVCGNQTGSTSQPRILGGYTARTTDYPWMVRVHITRERADPKSAGLTSDVCGGSILDRRHVLTAAHCVVTKSKSPNGRIADFYVVAGSDLGFVAQRSDVHSQIIQVENWYTHDMYNPDIQEQKSHDIAVLRLAQELRFCSSVGPVCLAPPMGFLGSDVTVTGYGDVLQEGMLASQLQAVKLSVRANDQCDDAFKRDKPNYVFQSHQICLHSPAKDACHGDSGGPAVLEWENRSYQVGVVGFGFPCNDKNRKMRFGGYTRVSSFIPWIRSVLKSNYTC